MKRGGINLDLLMDQENPEMCINQAEIVQTASQARQDKARQEYDRLRGLIENSDPTKVALLDGLLWEAAKARVQLQELGDIADATGPIRVSNTDYRKQAALPVIQELTKVRASYTHLMDRLMKHLDFSAADEDDSFADFL